MGRGLYGYVGGACTSAFVILEQRKTMARYYCYSLFVLLIMVSGVVCNSHSSPQPRGPDSTGETSTPQHQNDQAEDTAGECPADDEQVSLLINYLYFSIENSLAIINNKRSSKKSEKYF